MTAYAPRMTRVLDSAQLARMHDAALAMLARTGMKVDIEEMRIELARCPGFAVDGARVRIGEKPVQDWMAAFRQFHASQPPAPALEIGRYTYHVSDRPTWIVDRDHVAVRPLLRQDAIEGAKLLHVLAAQGVQGVTPGVPTDVPSALQPMEQFLIGAQYAGRGGQTCDVTDLRTARIIRDMNRVYGRELHMSAWCPSPLIFAGTEVDILWQFRREIKGTMAGSMPIMGLTGPCDPIGIMTLAMAEAVGGAAILHALLPGIPVSIFPHPEAADMQTGCMVLGSPEWELLDLMHREVIEFYGGRWNMKMLHTTASLPNAQVQIEHTTGALLGVLGGYTEFDALGELALDQVWCPAQLLLDLDIVAHEARVARGAASGAGLELERLPDIVDEVIREDMLFAAHETTVANLRTQYHRPSLLQRLGRPQWTDAGMPSVLRAAQARVDELISTYSYEPPADILRELRAICDKAKTALR